MKRYIPVDGHKGLFRDPDTGAILNINDAARTEYINKKNKIQRENKEKLNQERTINTLQSNVKELKKDIGDLKTLVHDVIKLLEKKN